MACRRGGLPGGWPTGGVAYRGGGLPGGWPTRRGGLPILFSLCVFMSYVPLFNKPCFPLHCASGPSLLSSQSLVECNRNRKLMIDHNDIGRARNLALQNLLNLF